MITEPDAFDFSLAPPGLGEIRTIRKNILWGRIPLHIQPDHINIFFIEDGDGWAIIDTGLASDRTKEVWQLLLAGPLSGKRFTRLLVTHHHPDHIGLAGWLCAELDIPLFTSQATYLTSQNILYASEVQQLQPYHDFFMRHGMDEAMARKMCGNGNRYAKMTMPLPPTYTRIIAGDLLNIGGNDYQIMMGEGHAPEHVMLHSRALKVLFAGDQVIAKIIPNFGVSLAEPHTDQFGLYLRTLDNLETQIGRDTLILAGHQIPFNDLAQRCHEIRKRLFDRCDKVLAICSTQACCITELIEKISPRTLTSVQFGLYFTDLMAVMNFLTSDEDVVISSEHDGIIRYRTNPKKI